LSNSTEAFISSMMPAGPAPKRPPHIVFLLIGAAWMPRLRSVPVKLLAIVAAVLTFGAALGVLYVILSAPVHAVDNVPAALVTLKPLETPVPAPAVAISDAAGNRHMLGDFRGRYVLVNLWASWCQPCVRELPALAQLQAAVPAKQLTILAVNVGRSDVKQTAAFLVAHKAGGLGVWLDPQVALMRAFRAYGLPTSVLIDPQGRVIARAVGPAEWGAPSAIAYFKALPLAPKPGAAKPAHAAS
jgi:thiol-disulfide isomerase/thioredoxin